MTWVVGVTAATSLGLVAVSSAQSKLLAPQRLAVASIRDLERSEALGSTRLGTNERISQDDLAAAAELAFANEVEWVEPVPVIAPIGTAKPNASVAVPQQTPIAPRTAQVPGGSESADVRNPDRDGAAPRRGLGPEIPRTTTSITRPTSNRGTEADPPEPFRIPLQKNLTATTTKPITTPKPVATTKRVRATKVSKPSASAPAPVLLAPAEPVIVATSLPTAPPFAPAPTVPTVPPTVPVVAVPVPGEPPLNVGAVTTPGVTVYVLPVTQTSTSVAAPAPVSTIPAVVPGTAAASTVPPTATSASTVPTSVSTVPTTAAPTTAAPTTVATIITTPLPTTAPPTTAAPTTTLKPTSATYTLVLGTVSAHCNGTAIVLDYAVPNDGASVSVKQQTRQITAKFVQNEKRSEIQISCATGTPRAEIDEKS